MDKKKDKPSLNKLRGDRLKSAVEKDKGKCDQCASQEPESPIQAMLQKLGMLGIPGLGDGGGCEHGAPKAVVVRVLKVGTPAGQPAGKDEPPVTGVKKVLEKDAKVTEAEHTSPFVQRCVAAITKGKPEDREEESSAFAKCVSTKNKSDKNLDAAAEERPGMAARHKQFEKSLDKVRKHHDHDA